MSTTLPSSSTPHAPAADAPIPLSVPSPNEPLPAPGEMFVTLENVDWDLYQAIDQTRGDTSRPLLIYSKGRLTLVSPLLHHDLYGEFLGALILAVCEEIDIPCMPAGFTTFLRKDPKIGVEGDRTFYLANEPRASCREGEHRPRGWRSAARPRH